MKADYPGKGSVGLAFPTPVLRKQFADTKAVNSGLRGLALEREKDSPGVGRSNIGGWHSGEDVFEWPGPDIAAFRSYVTEGVSEITQFSMEGKFTGPVDIDMDGGAWVNLCRDGGYNKIHNHPDCHWSGVYYVTLGTLSPDAPPNSGKIEFLDPRMGATDVGLNGADALPKLIVDPQPGLIVVFPSWLYHYVNPFHGTGERISIAFNINLRFKT